MEGDAPGAAGSRRLAGLSLTLHLHVPRYSALLCSIIASLAGIPATLAAEDEMMVCLRGPASTRWHSDARLQRDICQTKTRLQAEALKPFAL